MNFPLKLFFIVLGSIGYISCEALSYILQPYEKINFYYPITDLDSAIIYFYYQDRTDNEPVAITILDPLNQVIYSTKDEKLVDKNFKPQTLGDYTFSFSNEKGFLQTVIDFDISVSNDVDLPPYHEDIEGFNVTLTGLKSELRTMQIYQKYFRGRHNRSLYTVRATEKIIWWFSLLQCASIIGMASLQISIVKNFFLTTSKVRI